MRMDILSLVRRDFKKAMNLRTLVIWIALAGMGVFFFYTSGGRTKLVESDQIEFLVSYVRAFRKQESLFQKSLLQQSCHWFCPLSI